MKSINYIIVVLLFVNAFNIDAQNCRHYHKNEELMMQAKAFFDEGFQIYNQSKGIEFSKGESKKINLVLFGEKEFVLMFNASFEKSNLEYSIIDERTKEELFTNKVNSSQKIQFYNESTRKVIIELRHKTDRRSNSDEINSGCVGILILWK